MTREIYRRAGICFCAVPTLFFFRQWEAKEVQSACEEIWLVERFGCVKW